MCVTDATGIALAADAQDRERPTEGDLLIGLPCRKGLLPFVIMLYRSLMLSRRPVSAL